MSRQKGSKNKIKKTDQGFLEDFVNANSGEKKDTTTVNDISLSPPKYVASLKILGRVYSAKGETLEEIINNLKVGNWPKTASVLTIEKDGTKKERVLSASHTRNLFGVGSPTVKQMYLKWVKQLYA